MNVSRASKQTELEGERPATSDGPIDNSIVRLTEVYRPFSSIIEVHWEGHSGRIVWRGRDR